VAWICVDYDIMNVWPGWVSWDLLEGWSKKLGNGIDHGEIARFYDGTVQRDMQKWNACQVSSKATVPRPG
jgi:hypothetical protein